MEASNYIQAFFALLLVLGLIGITSYILKRFSLDKHLLKKTNSDKRLKIQEMLPLDARRRLLIVRRDNKEHLILLGTNSDILIESDIEAKEEEK